MSSIDDWRSQKSKLNRRALGGLRISYSSLSASFEESQDTQINLKQITIVNDVVNSDKIQSGDVTKDIEGTNHDQYSDNSNNRMTKTSLDNVPIQTLQSQSTVKPHDLQELNSCLKPDSQNFSAQTLVVENNPSNTLQSQVNSNFEYQENKKESYISITNLNDPYSSSNMSDNSIRDKLYSDDSDNSNFSIKTDEFKPKKRKKPSSSKPNAKTFIRNSKKNHEINDDDKNEENDKTNSAPKSTRQKQREFKEAAKLGSAALSGSRFQVITKKLKTPLDRKKEKHNAMFNSSGHLKPEFRLEQLRDLEASAITVTEKKKAQMARLEFERRMEHTLTSSAFLMVPNCFSPSVSYRAIHEVILKLFPGEVAKVKAFDASLPTEGFDHTDAEIAQMKEEEEYFANMRKKFDNCLLSNPESDINCPTGFDLHEAINSILLSRFGHSKFRPGQRAAIAAAIKGESTIFILPTGQGKSLTYQLASLFLSRVRRQLTVIVSPLIALMEDQVSKLPGGVRGAYLASSVPPTWRLIIQHMAEHGMLDILYVSPERLISSPILTPQIFDKQVIQQSLQRSRQKSLSSDSTKFTIINAIQDIILQDSEDYGMKKNYSSQRTKGIGLICVDEAHCMSEWSHQFRPSYLKLTHVLAALRLDGAGILSLTATASARTLADLKKRLNASVFLCPLNSGATINTELRSKCLLAPHQEDAWDGAGFGPRLVFRNNLTMTVTTLKNGVSTERSLQELMTRKPWCEMKSILVYVWQTAHCEQYSRILANNTRLVCEPYHAGLPPEKRKRTMEGFMAGSVNIVVATIAFGMGIDKSDVEGVIHASMPRSIEQLVQETGRVRRDGKPGYCHIFLSSDDFINIKNTVASSAPAKEESLLLMEKIFGPSDEALRALRDRQLLMNREDSSRASNDHADPDSFAGDGVGDVPFECFRRILPSIDGGFVHPQSGHLCAVRAFAKKSIGVLAKVRSEEQTNVLLSVASEMLEKEHIQLLKLSAVEHELGKKVGEILAFNDILPLSNIASKYLLESAPKSGEWRRIFGKYADLRRLEKDIKTALKATNFRRSDLNLPIHKHDAHLSDMSSEDDWKTLMESVEEVIELLDLATRVPARRLIDSVNLKASLKFYDTPFTELVIKDPLLQRLCAPNLKNITWKVRAGTVTINIPATISALGWDPSRLLIALQRRRIYRVVVTESNPGVISIATTAEKVYDENMHQLSDKELDALEDKLFDFGLACELAKASYKKRLITHKQEIERLDATFITVSTMQDAKNIMNSTRLLQGIIQSYFSINSTHPATEIIARAAACFSFIFDVNKVDVDEDNEFDLDITGNENRILSVASKITEIFPFDEDLIKNPLLKESSCAAASSLLGVALSKETLNAAVMLWGAFIAHTEAKHLTEKFQWSSSPFDQICQTAIDDLLDLELKGRPLRAEDGHIHAPCEDHHHSSEAVEITAVALTAQDFARILTGNRSALFNKQTLGGSRDFGATPKFGMLRSLPYNHVYMACVKAVDAICKEWEKKKRNNLSKNKTFSTMY